MLGCYDARLLGCSAELPNNKQPNNYQLGTLEIA